MVNKTVFSSEVGEQDETIVSKWDWNAVKNALDDSARKFLVSQKKFQEDHSLMNGRLIISTITVMFSLYGILYDYLNPFPESKSTLIVCVIAYFISIGVLTAYTQFVEKTCFGAALQMNDSGKPNTWKFSSKQKSDSLDVYQLEIQFTDGNTNKTKTVLHGNSVSKYFDENGKLCTKSFYNDLSRYCTSVFDDRKSK